MTSPTRRRQGDLTRTRVVEAVIAIVVAEGSRAVTHRRVATEAGVSLSATTYYFRSKEELLSEGLKLFVRLNTERTTDRLSAFSPDAAEPEMVADEIASWYAGEAAEHPETWIVLLEAVGEAARHGTLAAELRVWNEAADRWIAEALRHLGNVDPQVPRAVRACADGLVIEQLFERRPDFEEAVLRPALRRLVSRAVPAGGKDG